MAAAAVLVDVAPALGWCVNVLVAELQGGLDASTLAESALH